MLRKTTGIAVVFGKMVSLIIHSEKEPKTSYLWKQAGIFCFPAHLFTVGRTLVETQQHEIVWITRWQIPFLSVSWKPCGRAKI